MILYIWDFFKVIFTLYMCDKVTSLLFLCFLYRSIDTYMCIYILHSVLTFKKIWLRGKINWGIGTDIHTLLYVKQITNKNLQCSTGNCSVLCNKLYGKRILKRIDVCICITDPLCCTAETNTTLLISYTPMKINF